jgi:NAD(P)-dependent dehydrogenase (short-subunit alcohol dehydrogenase family)
VKLHNKIALVIGWSTGIGKASALLFAEEGAKLVVADINDEDGRATVDQIKKQGGTALFLEVDVSKSSSVEKMIKELIENFCRIDIIFNNAGISLYKPFSETNEEDWDRVINTNLKGVFLGCKYGVQQMLKQGGGVIINTASEIGLVGAKNYSAYCASKGGVIQLTRALALELADKNIRVNCLCPGTTMTPLLEKSIRTRTATLGVKDAETMRRIVEQKNPLGRIAMPMEIARGALFLASDDSSYINGSTLVIDGGVTAG